MEMTNIIRINKEVTLTSNGTHTNGNCKPVLAIEVQKVFNSYTDVAEYFGTTVAVISNVLNGRQKAIRMYERDENGKRIRYIGKCHLVLACDAATAMDAVLDVGRKAIEELHKANKRIAEFEQKAAMWDALQAEQDTARKAEEERRQVIAKATEKRDKCYDNYIDAMEQYEQAERELAKLTK